MKNNDKNQRMEEKNRALENMLRNMIDVKEYNENIHLLDEQWKNKYNLLLQQYENLIYELQQGKKENKIREKNVTCSMT